MRNIDGTDPPGGQFGAALQEARACARSFRTGVDASFRAASEAARPFVRFITALAGLLDGVLDAVRRDRGGAGSMRARSGRLEQGQHEQAQHEQADDQRVGTGPADAEREADQHGR